MEPLKMNLKELDLFHLHKLTSHQVDHVTCLECCKYYIAPETAVCGHTLCHGCWRGRRTCPACAAPIERKALRLNLQIQNLSEHIHALSEAFEKLFNIKLDEFILDETSHEVQSESDPTKNVKDWLASSQNQFSAPILNSESFSQESHPIEISTSKIQIHMDSKKSKTPQKIIYVQPPQDDWDKIEQLPDTEEICVNNKENLAGQKNQQPFTIGEEYSTDNPRRSSRKRECSIQNEDISRNPDIEKHSSKNSNSESDKKSNKAKQNWNNVKRMRKEFSKLNKKNRSKLNVSIEMCKKTQSTTKAHIGQERLSPPNKDSQPVIYTIEDNTPDINKDGKFYQENPSSDIVTDNNKKENNVVISAEANVNNGTSVDTNINNIGTSADTSTHNVADGINKINENCNPILAQKECQNNEKASVSNNNTPNDVSIHLNEPKKNHLCCKCMENKNNLDDIEITFKVGNTLTNITIKRKNNDVQLKVKADREVQTSLGANSLTIKKNVSQGVQNINPQEFQINISNTNSVTATQIEGKKITAITESGANINKSRSTKKNTASADTATGQFEITESVQKELSNIMECVDTLEERSHFSQIETEQKSVNANNKRNSNDYINDIDIFDNESVHGQNVHALDKSKQSHSEILMSTIKTKTQKHADKRNREINNDDEIPDAKKIKTLETSDIIKVNTNSESMLQPCDKDSESINYDVVMGEVFASIDADIEKSQKSAKNKQEKNLSSSNNNKFTMKSQCTEKIFQSQTNQLNAISTQKLIKPSDNEYINEKYSENVFSIIEKDEEVKEFTKRRNDDDGSTQRHIENLLTPGMCQDLISVQENIDLDLNKEQCTPFHDQDDSDKSVVEETPQKPDSFLKPKNTNDASKIGNHLQRLSDVSKAASSSQLVKSVINVSDMVDTTKIHKEPDPKKTLETPLTINKFVDHIKHKSTPVARKSLNFDSENIDDIDPEQTLCPSSVVGKTTQEKEFMIKAFEQTPHSQVRKPLTMKNKESNLKYCIAGSCLTPAELTNLKYLCQKHNWTYVDKYTKELTHLVVGVDENNRSQRSVKYMCALAASKWIVSYEWVHACISTNIVVGENQYEALDGTGEPGPKRARLAKTKLFEGITFYCMPPFSVLDVDTLKEMLEAAGGRVAREARAARADGPAPRLLLAEPELTQEDRFVYLALELSIVPVNYEWVLNCLGSYTLSALHEQLLCPAALLPRATAAWPAALVARDCD